MKDYITICACVHDNSNKIYLFRAPTWAQISEGTRVVVDTNLGEQKATVLAGCTVAKDSPEEKMFRKLTGATGEIKKIIGYYKFTEYDYGEEGKANE